VKQATATTSKKFGFKLPNNKRSELTSLKTKEISDPSHKILNEVKKKAKVEEEEDKVPSLGE